MAANLPLATRLNYGVSEMGVNIFVVLASVVVFEYMLLYLKIPPFWASAVFFGTKVWDVVTDPLIGRWSDSQRSRFGRRLPFMFVGAFVLAAGFVLMFLAPFGEAGGWQARAWWMAFALIFTYTGLSLVGVPYGAMTAELTQDYQERSNLTAIRMAFATLGLLVGAAAFITLSNYFAAPDTALMGAEAFVPNQIQGNRMAAFLMFPMLCLPTLWTVLKLRNVPLRNAQARALPLIAQARIVLANRPFLWLASAYLIQVAMITLVVANLTSIALYVMERPDYDTLQLQLYLMISLATLLAFPAWVWLGRRYEKRTLHLTFTLGMGLCLTGLIFLEPGREWLLYSLLMITGLFYAGYNLFPWAMLPDTISHAQRQGGEDESLEGLFNGWWTASQKLGIALGPALAGLILGWAGYATAEPGQPLPTAQEQGETAVRAVHLMISVVPGLIFLTTMTLMRNYGLTRADQDGVAGGGKD